MDGSFSLTPNGPLSPLQTSTPDRVNQRRDSNMTPFRTDGYESPVLEKISQFNNMSGQSRKATDALKRAVLGREEAEAEMRRLKDEIQQLQHSVEQGKQRERKVGERLETVMDSYGRAKETHAHTQALWEKEIRRTRKENFKSQSTIVKLQEELKTARTAAKINEECLQREKERSRDREQEAFTARYQIVGVQEQLDKALERIKVVEQERDAYKTAAKNEEIVRMAAEGQLPLPPADETEEFASRNKVQKKRKRDSAKDGGRVSLSNMELVSSAASEMEIEELTLQVAWEKHRAERAQEMVEFLQAECRMHSCPSFKDRCQTSHYTPRRSPEPVESTTPAENTAAVADLLADLPLEDVAVTAIEAEREPVAEPATEYPESTREESEPMLDIEISPASEEMKKGSPRLGVEEPEVALDEDQAENQYEDLREDLLGDIFTLEQPEPAAHEPTMKDLQAEPEPEPEQFEEPEPSIRETELQTDLNDEGVAPPADVVPELEQEFVTGQSEEIGHGSDTEERRESPPEPESAVSEPELLIVKSKKGRTSTIFCPQQGIFRTVSEQEAEAAALEEGFQAESVAGEDEDNIDIVLPDAVEEARGPCMYARTPSVEPPSCAIMARDRMARDRTSLQSLLSAPHSEEEASIPNTFSVPTVEDTDRMDTVALAEAPEETMANDDNVYTAPASPTPTMYASTARFKVTTTTVPVRDEASQYNSSFTEKLRTPSGSSNASFDLTDPALTPTMTREEALAKIRERRGRARSVAQATAVPPKKLVPIAAKRDISATSSKAPISKTTPKTISKTGTTTTRTRPAATAATKPVNRSTSRSTSRAASRTTSRTTTSRTTSRTR